MEKYYGRGILAKPAQKIFVKSRPESFNVKHGNEDSS